MKQEAVDALADWYYASSYRVPIGTEDEDKAIAGWLNQNTGGLLSQETREIQTEVDNLLRLYNTIYYKSSWRDASRAAGRGRTCSPPPTARSRSGVHAPHGERRLSEG